MILLWLSVSHKDMDMRLITNVYFGHISINDYQSRFLPRGSKIFCKLQKDLFNWTNSPITPRFGSTIRSSYHLKPLNIYSYWYGRARRYTGGAVRPEKRWFYVFWSLMMGDMWNFEGSGGIYFQGYIILSTQIFAGKYF